MKPPLVELLQEPDAQTLTRFVEHWHGPPRATSASQVVEAPDLLRAFHDHMQRWPGLVRHNRMPERLEAVGDGRVVFMVENQAVDLWATEPVGDDPPVWSKRNEAGLQWELEGEPLSRFLLEVAPFETILGNELGASAAWLRRSQAEAALGALDELGLAPWRRPLFPSRFLAGDGILAFMTPNPGPESDDYVSVFVAAIDPNSAAFLNDIVDERWEHIQLNA